MAADVAVLAGGLSLEREVSLRSGHRVTSALGELGHTTRLLDIDDRLVQTLSATPADLVFLTVHGATGEDGSIQSLLELLGLPYTGSDTLASALAWDKPVFKGLCRREGLPTPDWVTVSAPAVRDLGAGPALAGAMERLGGPVFVKPAQGGASMGVRPVDVADELAPAVLAAFSYHDVALLERAVQGAEVAVSLVAGEPLPPVEIQPKQGRYDYAARYTPGATEFHAPARLEEATLARCREVAAAAVELVGCRHVARADLMVDADGTPWLLELDTCPGMTETSLLPLAAQAAGLGFSELCGRIAEAALADAEVTPVGTSG